MTKIAILDDYIGVALDYANWNVLPDDAEITVYREAISPERLVAELADYEIVVITQQRARFPRAVLESLPKLKLLVCNGRTSNVVDHAARIERGILLCGTADTSQPAPGRPYGGGTTPRGLPTPSEMAWALIFAVAKRIVIEDRVIRAGGWQTGFPIPLAGKTLGLLGAGNLGGAMVPVAKALGMDVVAWSQNLTEERCAQLGVTRVTKDELLSSSDVLGVFLVFGERSRNTLRADDLARMKRGAILVNISRGPIVEESALIAALRSGHLAGAGLDVFDREP
ncbi:MAG: D-2-hydroxyacid dehydrogenase family protein, partial [Chloroflexi bacterium]|nr:D-2-hydroxyacid dehydrogenase family protein [Chloroflexota bacterium]